MKQRTSLGDLLNERVSDHMKLFGGILLAFVLGASAAIAMFALLLSI